MARLRAWLRELVESLQHPGRIALAVEAPEEDSLAPVRAAAQPLAEQRGLAQPAQSGDGDEPHAGVGCPGIEALQHVEAPGELLVLRGLVDEALANLRRGRGRRAATGTGAVAGPASDSSSTTSAPWSFAGAG